MEATKCLKPSDNGHDFGDRASVQAATPAPATSGWSGRRVGLAPTYLGALVSSGNFQHRGLHFCGSCDGVGMINGHSRLQQTAASAPGGLGSVIAATTASTYLRFGHRDRDHNPAFSGRGRPDGGTNLEKRQ